MLEKENERVGEDDERLARLVSKVALKAEEKTKALTIVSGAAHVEVVDMADADQTR